MLIYKILIVKMYFIICRRFTLGPCKSRAVAKLPAKRCFACAVLSIKEIDVGRGEDSSVNVAVFSVMLLIAKLFLCH